MPTEMKSTGWGDNEDFPITITHDECGGKMVLTDDSGCGTSWTGCWGGISVTCSECGYSEYLMEK